MNAITRGILSHNTDAFAFYFQDCIDPWLETKAVCAYCKAKVEVKKSICDRLFRSASDRMGIHLVTLQQDPTPHHFSSSRRTYTSQEVKFKDIRIFLFVFDTTRRGYTLFSCSFTDVLSCRRAVVAGCNLFVLSVP